MIQIILVIMDKRYREHRFSTFKNAMCVRNFSTGLFVSLWLALSTGAIGQTHEGHSGAMSHAHDSAELPMEIGQSAFAAIAEIVALLENDPETDWSAVNIDALRNHLADMDELTLSASVTTKELGGQVIQFQVTGEGRTLKAIQAMIPEHAKMVENSNAWGIEVMSEPDGVTLKVSPESADEYTKLKALGFFGFMTIGAHHQVHHLHIAKGAGH